MSIYIAKIILYSRTNEKQSHVNKYEDKRNKKCKHLLCGNK